MREVALDTETTGLDPATGHRVVEIGCVEMKNRLRTGEVFHVYLNPERDMPDEAFRVHGLSNSFLADKPVFSQVVDDLMAFVADSPLIIHNAQFDLKFINAELARLGFSAIPTQQAVDTVTMARKKFPGAPANLNALCKRFNIDLSARTKHGALLDAELLADVYLELTGGRQDALLLDIANTATHTSVTEAQYAITHRVFSPTEEELLVHAEFLKQLKNPLWNAA